MRPSFVTIQPGRRPELAFLGKIRLRGGVAVLGLIGVFGFSAAASDVVQPVVPIRARPFNLEHVRLLDGPFRKAMELDRNYLLALDVDRLLHAYRVRAGIPSTARPLGGWERMGPGVRGAFLGHYLSACALMFASSGDDRLKDRGDRIVAGLAECQRKIGTGFVATFLESLVDQAERGDNAGLPWYALHKVLAGLLDMNAHCGSRSSLAVARGLAGWAKARCDRLSEARMQTMLHNEHGGMNEALASLYARTGEKKYLELAERFNHRAVIDPMAQGRDILSGLHANTQIPKFIGAAAEYELTGNPAYRAASTFFWDTVVKERSYVIGGHSDGEIFSPREKLSLAFGTRTTETCNTYNMLKLTRHLFTWEPKAEYADYCERALLNHILPSQNGETGMMVYYLPLRPGMKRTYNTFDDSFWCCTGTGIENHARYGDSIYFRDDRGTLYWNLFLASELSWQEIGLKIRQETGFPTEQKSRLVFSAKRPTTLSVKVRHPSWAGPGFAIRVNGEMSATAGEPGQYAEITREWRDGDILDVSLPFALHTEVFADNPDRLAFLHGPLVLAAPVEDGEVIPVIVGEASRTLAVLTPESARPSTFAGSPAAFRVAGLGRSEGKSLRLVPLYRVPPDSHYVVYWDRFTPDRWKEKEPEYRAEQVRRDDLSRRTVDRVRPGVEEDERAHGFEGRHSHSGGLQDTPWRDASDGGYFRYLVKVAADRPNVLSVTYWGSDAGSRKFDLVVEGRTIATQTLRNNRPDELFDQTYEIPDDLTRGKDRVSLTFQAHPHCTAGGVFGIRLLRVER